MKETKKYLKLTKENCEIGELDEANAMKRIKSLFEEGKTDKEMLKEAKDIGLYDNTKKYIDLTLADMAKGRSDQYVHCKNKVANIKKHINLVTNDMEN